MTYKVGVLDDEALQIRVNGLYLEDIAKRNHYDIKAFAFQTAEKLYKYFQNNNLDILLLDIDLDGKSGIEIAQELIKEHPNLIIIFVTGHREFTGEAYDIEAIGYIVKPVELDKLERILKKCILQINALRATKPSSTIIITEENLKKKLLQSDIYYIERQGSKSLIHTKEKTYQIYETISSLCERLDNTFIRVNQSEVIPIKNIKEIHDNSVFLKNNQQISIGRTFKNNVMKAFLESK